MSLAQHQLRLLAERASDAAREAGAFIQGAQPDEVQRKQSGSSPASQIVTEVDHEAERIILEALAPTVEAYGLGVLSEERPDSRMRLEREYFWCIDPLDGTLPFIEGKAGFAVSIGLVARDGTPLIGVIFDPVLGTLYRSVVGLGAMRDERPWAPLSRAAQPTLSVFFDRSFMSSPDYATVTESLRVIATDMGLGEVEVHTDAGAVMKACRALASPPACYFKFPKPSEGGGSLWDFAASACLFREVGAVATDIYGQPLDLNRPDSTFMNHRGVLFATDHALASRIQSLHSPKATVS